MGLQTAISRLVEWRFAMNVYPLQEFLGVVAVLAVLVGIFVFLGVLFILFQEGIRRAIPRAKTGVARLESLSPKDQRLRRTEVRPVLR
jgi:O-antigen/teichoic acid export membrane protein